MPYSSSTFGGTSFVFRHGCHPHTEITVVVIDTSQPEHYYLELGHLELGHLENGDLRIIHRKPTPEPHIRCDWTFYPGDHFIQPSWTRRKFTNGPQGESFQDVTSSTNISWHMEVTHNPEYEGQLLRISSPECGWHSQPVAHLFLHEGTLIGFQVISGTSVLMDRDLLHDALIFSFLHAGYGGMSMFNPPVRPPVFESFTLRRHYSDATTFIIDRASPAQPHIRLHIGASGEISVYEKTSMGPLSYLRGLYDPPSMPDPQWTRSLSVFDDDGQIVDAVPSYMVSWTMEPAEGSQTLVMLDEHTGQSQEVARLHLDDSHADNIILFDVVSPVLQDRDLLVDGLVFAFIYSTSSQAEVDFNEGRTTGDALQA